MSMTVTVGRGGSPYPISLSYYESINILKTKYKPIRALMSHLNIHSKDAFVIKA